MRRRMAAALVLIGLAFGGGNVLAEGEVDRDLVADLIADLGDPQEHVRDEAADSLAGLGPEVVGDLLGVIKKGVDPARLEAIHALGRMGGPASDAVPVLDAFVKGENTPLREAAIAALQRILPPEGAAPPSVQVPLERLIDELASETQEQRLAAIRALGRRRADRDRAADALGPLLNAREEVVFVETVRALALLGPDFMADALLSHLGRWPARVRFEIVDATFAIGEGAVPAVVRRLATLNETRKDPDGTRPWLHGAAWEMGAPVVPHALAALASEEASVRAAGAELLGAVQKDTKRAAPALVDALGDGSGVVRREAARALARLGEEGSEFAIPALALVLGDQRSRAQTEAAEALGSIILSAARRSPRTAGRSAEIRASVDLALDWLVRHQSEDGRWDADGFAGSDAEEDRCTGPGEAKYDLGVTALSTLAFLQRGSTGRLDDVADAHGASVRKALRLLAAHQDSEGRIGVHLSQHWHYDHAIAAIALVEGYARSGSPVLEHFAQRAVDYVGASRDPKGGWRYTAREGTDTSASGWMVAALTAGHRAGLRTDLGAREPMLAYLGAATNAESGRTGYHVGAPDAARTAELLTKFPQNRTESMTAAALKQWLHFGLDSRALAVSKAIERCLAIRPSWNTEDGSIDLYYWYQASVALNLVGGEAARSWNAALKKALLDGQNGKAGGCSAGSWGPLDPWSASGGRVYMTALGALSLEAANGLLLPIRPSAARHPPTVKALRALEAAANDPELRASARAAAKRALHVHERF